MMTSTTTAGVVNACVADPRHPSHVASKLGELPALTGLRFFAAFFVLCGHAAPVLIRFSPDLPLVRNIPNSLTGIGMTLFFVLSGFVIHYNYADVVRAPLSRNLAKFCIARFARLYPLFVVLVVATLVLFIHVVVLRPLRWTGADWPAAPFYLGLAQSWVYILLDGRSLLVHLSALQVTWSISTEWFLYCWYPVVAWFLATWHRRLARSSVLIAISFLAMALYAFAYWHEQKINEFAESIWGPPAAAADYRNNSFYFWLLAFSPVSRIHEFLLGVATAHIFISTHGRPVSQRERRVGGAVLAIAFAGVIVMCSYQSNALGPSSRYVNSVGFFVFPLLTAVILFCCARYRSLASRGLSANWVVTCGDASYSIYLFHVIFIKIVEVPAVLPLTWMHITEALLRFVLCAFMTIIFSIASYRLYEAPARRSVRTFLARWTAPGSSDAAHWLIVTLAVGVPVALSAVGWYISLR
jgi:peptidoglycan/LPS O-acetylase OafA/YrhL